MFSAIRVPVVIFLAGGLLFFSAQQQLRDVKRAHVNAEVEVVLPLLIQVIMAGGDRYLAASWATVRALVTETGRMTRDEFQILGQVQKDVSWLNPAHEDNYYIAAAILPWEGELDAAQTILRRATQARPYDYQPPFYYAFHMVHFKKDALAASDWLLQAAPKLPDAQERLIMENYAARWLDGSQDLDLAARIVEAMAAQTKRKDFADYLRKRAQRLRDLAMLRKAANEYSLRHGRPPRLLQELKTDGLVKQLPVDSFGAGFGIDEQGVPIFSSSKPK